MNILLNFLFVLAIVVFWIVCGICAYWIAYRAGAVDNPENEFFCAVVGGLAALIITLLCLALKKIRDFVESL